MRHLLNILELSVEEIDRLITDREPSDEWKKRLERSNVQLFCRSES